MEANQANFLGFLEGKKQFVIPIYQRSYSWTIKQCEQLWDDIVSAGSDESVRGHFIGSIVYIKKGIYQVTSIPQLLVIDGQQRLTTLSLLLSALGNIIENSQLDLSVTKEEIMDSYLINKYEKGNLHYKIMLTKVDKDTLIQILEDKELSTNYSKRINENYAFFEGKIRSSKIDLMTLYYGICKLMIVDISLDSEKDNPQLIFESLNSTGLELSQADLIRNYVLMGLQSEQQESLYNDYWYPMEQSFGQVDYVAQFDRFMRDYLTVKTGTIPKMREVYDSFKAYAKDGKSESIQDIVEDIYQYSKYFVNMALEKEENKDLNQIFSDINTLKVDVAYPLLLELYADYADNILNIDDFKQILKFVESYVFRRAICGIPTNSLNKTFSTLTRAIDKTNYLESFEISLYNKKTYRRFPSNDEFGQELLVKDIYNLRLRNHLLTKLENYNRKEKVDVAEYTIEHIMPQNKKLSDAWKNELGDGWKEIQEKYLHTIGNLTLTGYNSELSDRTFIEKRDMEGGFADSPIRLNRELAKLEHWNETEIKTRSQYLAELAMKIWDYPNVTIETLIKHCGIDSKEKSEIDSSFEYHAYLTGEMKNLFEQLQKRILNLDASVTEEFKSHYIAYKTTTNFVDVTPQKSQLKLSLNIAFDEINDPQDVCRDVKDISTWGNGNVEVLLKETKQLDYIMFLIKQAFEEHVESISTE
jgi:uncharacterized protein with ParB-like and HNH nuclease domain/predicted transport protein